MMLNFIPLEYNENNGENSKIRYNNNFFICYCLLSIMNLQILRTVILPINTDAPVCSLLMKTK